jgi:hypothetical protein
MAPIRQDARAKPNIERRAQRQIKAAIRSALLANKACALFLPTAPPHDFGGRAHDSLWEDGSW